MEDKIIQGNKLIHEFMGGKWFSKRYPRNHGIGGSMLDLLNNAPDIIIEKAKYHSSWDWLMPVVEKIEEMQSLTVDSRVSIERDSCNIYFNNGTSEYEFNAWDGNKLKTTYGHIVEFIKWYNTQNKQS